jgi:DNA repair protein RadC
MTVTFVRELKLNYRGNHGESFDVARSPERAAQLIRRVLPDNVREHFVALLVDSRTQVVGYYVAATGTGSSCPVGVREIFQAAVVAGAQALVVGHNHPTGNPEPSSDDRAVTQRLRLAGELLGIPILDHLIVGTETFFSLHEHGEL